MKLVRDHGRFNPIPGMEVVSDLITKARYESEHLYSLFRVISLARFNSDGFIEIRSPVCQSVVFTDHEDFFRQLAYFDYICDTMKPTADNPLARIDLRLGRNVPVAFRDPVKAGTSYSADRRRAAPVFFPSFQRNPTQREL